MRASASLDGSIVQERGGAHAGPPNPCPGAPSSAPASASLRRRPASRRERRGAGDVGRVAIADLVRGGERRPRPRRLQLAEHVRRGSPHGRIVRLQLARAPCLRLPARAAAPATRARPAPRADPGRRASGAAAADPASGVSVPSAAASAARTLQSRSASKPERIATKFVRIELRQRLDRGGAQPRRCGSAGDRSARSSAPSPPSSPSAATASSSKRQAGGRIEHDLDERSRRRPDRRCGRAPGSLRWQSTGRAHR